MAPVELTFIPETEHQKIYIRARIYVLIYAGVIALAFVTRSFLPLMLIGLPNLYGSWLTVIYGLTQHAGLAENVLDHRLNTRTVYMNFINRYLYWNMGYHVEHHIFPLVPYYNLPKLHALIRTDMPTPYLGLLMAYQEIVPTLLRQSKDPDYFVRRQLPHPATARKLKSSRRSRRRESRWWMVGSKFAQGNCSKQKMCCVSIMKIKPMRSTVPPMARFMPRMASAPMATLTWQMG